MGRWFYEPDVDLFVVRTEVLLGGAGNDVIHGNGNSIDTNDSVVRGTDVMDGGAGDDRLSADVHTRSSVGGSSYDGNIMTGGAGTDRFMFNDELLTLGHLFTLEVATGGTVTDFDRGEGDKLVFDLDDPTVAHFVGERADIGVGECGFYRSGGDTFVKYVIGMAHDDRTGTDYLVAISVKLEDYAGPVTASDVLLV